MAPPPPCGLVIVSPWRDDEASPGTLRPASATKAYEYRPDFGWLKIADYDPHHRVGLTVVDGLESMDDLAEAVQLAAEHDAYLVRGALTPEAVEAQAKHGDGPRGALLNRRMYPARRGDKPSLCDVPRRWVMLDIDGWVIPDHLSIHDADDHERIVDTMVRDVLPPAFHDARCFWQWSSSCALEDPSIAKAHLWFWLAEPVDNDRMRATCVEIGVDHAPFSAVQPHYVAAPRLIGAPDPLPARAGWRDGEVDEVPLPPAPSPRAYHAASGGGSPGDWTAPLRLIGDAEGRLGFYAAIRGAIWRYADVVSRGGTRNDIAVVSLIRKAIALAPKAPTRSPRAIAMYESAGWLMRMIEQAFRKNAARRAGGRA